MRSMHVEADRDAILARARRLSPGAIPRWGRMNASQMLVHITEAMSMASGDLLVRSKRHPVRLPVIKQLMLYVIPMPKNLPTAPELIAREPAAFDVEMRSFVEAMQRFVGRDPLVSWPDHPVFGPMTRHSWGVLAHKHTDHHLTQFGL